MPFGTKSRQIFQRKIPFVSFLFFSFMQKYSTIKSVRPILKSECLLGKLSKKERMFGSDNNDDARFLSFVLSSVFVFKTFGAKAKCLNFKGKSLTLKETTDLHDFRLNQKKIFTFAFLKVYSFQGKYVEKQVGRALICFWFSKTFSNAAYVNALALL